MTKYEYRVLARTIYGAALLACDFMAALVMAATDGDPERGRELMGKADEARRELVMEYRANGGSVGREQDE